MLKVSTGVEVFLESQLRFVCPLSDHVALQGICPNCDEDGPTLLGNKNAKRETP